MFQLFFQKTLKISLSVCFRKKNAIRFNAPSDAWFLYACNGNYTIWPFSSELALKNGNLSWFIEIGCSDDINNYTLFHCVFPWLVPPRCRGGCVGVQFRKARRPRRSSGASAVRAAVRRASDGSSSSRSSWARRCTFPPSWRRVRRGRRRISRRRSPGQV